MVSGFFAGLMISLANGRSELQAHFKKRRMNIIPGEKPPAKGWWPHCGNDITLCFKFVYFLAEYFEASSVS